MHGIWGGRFDVQAHLHEWTRVTERPQWRHYLHTPEDTTKVTIRSFYERYEKNILRTDDIDILSSDLYAHVIGSLLRKDDEKLLERFSTVTSETDRKAKAIGLLKAFNFLAVARKFGFCPSDYRRCMEYGDFFDSNFIMLYTYHYLVHADKYDQMRACGVNFKRYFTEPLIEITEHKLTSANQMLESLLSLEYVHPEIVQFYKDYAEKSEMSLEKLDGWLNNAVGRTYNFIEPR